MLEREADLIEAEEFRLNTPNRWSLSMTVWYLRGVAFWTISHSLLNVYKLTVIGSGSYLLLTNTPTPWKLKYSLKSGLTDFIRLKSPINGHRVKHLSKISEKVKNVCRFFSFDFPLWMAIIESRSQKGTNNLSPGVTCMIQKYYFYHLPEYFAYNSLNFVGTQSVGTQSWALNRLLSG